MKPMRLQCARSIHSLCLPRRAARNTFRHGNGQHDDEVMLYAFEILALDGNDLRKLPLHLRKTNLARLLARRPEGIFVSDFEQGEIGPDLFRHACLMGLEGMVSKRRDRPYRAGRSPERYPGCWRRCGSAASASGRAWAPPRRS